MYDFCSYSLDDSPYPPGFTQETLLVAIDRFKFEHSASWGAFLSNIIVMSVCGYLSYLSYAGFVSYNQANIGQSVSSWTWYVEFAILSLIALQSCHVWHIKGSARGRKTSFLSYLSFHWFFLCLISVGQFVIIHLITKPNMNQLLIQFYFFPTSLFVIPLLNLLICYINFLHSFCLSRAHQGLATITTHPNEPIQPKRT
jgi:hypothetical protein